MTEFPCPCKVVSDSFRVASTVPWDGCNEPLTREHTVTKCSNIMIKHHLDLYLLETMVRYSGQLLAFAGILLKTNPNINIPTLS